MTATRARRTLDVGPLGVAFAFIQTRQLRPHDGSNGSLTFTSTCKPCARPQGYFVVPVDGAEFDLTGAIEAFDATESSHVCKGPW